MRSKRFAIAALTLLSILLGSLLPTGCTSAPPVTVAVDTLCETPRYHTTDEQRAGVKADPGTWYPLFQWLAAFDARWDKRCGK
jgi:hypothetical protein